MNPRRPIVVLLVFGLCVVLVLTFVPYSLTLLSRASDRVAAAIVRIDDAEAIREMEGAKPVVPSFDVAGWYAMRGENLETHGALIESLDGNGFYGAHNSEKPFNPASLIKLATSLLALKRLGPDYRYETKVYVDGSLAEDGHLRGRVHVEGSDPTFGDVAGAMIGRELRARGILKVRDNLTVSREFCFNFSDSPDESAERLLRMVNFDEKQASKPPPARRAAKRPKKKANASIRKGEDGGDPSAEEFRLVASPPSGKPLFTLESHPLRDVLLFMNAHSSNFVAERIGRLFGGAEGLGEFLVNDLKLPSDDVQIATTSGREQNRLSARSVVAVIRALHLETKQRGLTLADIMPVASDDSGTLQHRFIGSPLEAALVGKTGTLTREVDGGMAALGGVVRTEKSGEIVFALLDQGNRIWENKQLEDELLNEVIVAHDTPVRITNHLDRDLLPTSNLRLQF